MKEVWWIIVILTATMVNLPQLVKILRCKDSSNVSPTTYWLLLFIVINYWYRATFILKDWVFMTTNSTAFVICILVLWAIYRYRGGKR